MTSPPRSEGEKPLLTPRDLRLLYVVALLCLAALGMLAAKRLGYWPGPAVTVVTVPTCREPLDLNRAQWWELATLPGIGEVRARAIVQARPFRSVDELGKVPGITSKVIEGLRSMVQAGKSPEDSRE